MNRMIRSTVVCVALVISVSCSRRQPQSDGNPSVPTGKLAFVTSRSFGGAGTISILGASVTPFEGYDPELSSDGTRIVYATGNAPQYRLFTRVLSGPSSANIGNNPLSAESPSLSPDGSKLLFVVWPKNRESSQIYLADADGGNWTPLTTGSYYNWYPRWSPDGKNIVFESTRDGQRQIYLMDAEGKNQRNLTNDKLLSHSPSWSPDGSKIAFMSRDENDRANIYTINTDGSDRKDISKGTTRDSEPVWSPDGKWIAFTRTAGNSPHEGAMDIWIMKDDGTEQRQITQNAEGLYSYQPSWGR